MNNQRAKRLYRTCRMWANAKIAIDKEDGKLKMYDEQKIDTITSNITQGLYKLVKKKTEFEVALKTVPRFAEFWEKSY